ncbi:hypothetical protein QTI19_35435 [Variovorax sp. J22R203]|nr:hypothetical protein [Variovorax sp. J22R203]
MVNDLRGLSRVVEQLVAGPAAAYVGAVCGVLVVEVVRQPLPEVWTRQYGVLWSPIEQNRFNHWPWGIRHFAEYLVTSRRVFVPKVEACSVLKLPEVQKIIERSGLRLAKEAPNEAWLSRLR